MRAEEGEERRLYEERNNNVRQNQDDFSDQPALDAN